MDGNKKIPLEKPEQELTILEASRKWPKSKAYAFKMSERDPNVMYFRIEEPQFVNLNGIRSTVRCLKFNSIDGYLVVTNVPIRINDTIIDITIEEFANAVIHKMEKLQQEGIIEPLIPYKTFGFLTE